MIQSTAEGNGMVNELFKMMNQMRIYVSVILLYELQKCINAALFEFGQWNQMSNFDV